MLDRAGDADRVRRVELERSLDDRQAQCDERLQSLACRVGACQFNLVEHRDQRDLGRLGGHGRTRHQVERETRLDCHHDQRGVDIGGQQLAAKRIGAIQQVAPRQHLLDHAFAGRGRGPLDLIAAGQWPKDKPLPDPEQFLARAMLDGTLKEMNYVPTKLDAPKN